MPSQPHHPMVNCHAHIFHLDHVPNEFGKTFLPLGLHKVVTVSLVQWYYRNLTSRGSQKYRRFIHRSRKLKYGIYSVLQFTYILWWAYRIVYHLVRGLFSILASFFKIDNIFSKTFRAVVYRYMTMARYATNYQDQASIYTNLVKNYPPGTKQVILSMDMEYMEAGKPKTSFLKQLDELKILAGRKDELCPFIFVHPRRISQTRGSKDDFQRRVIKELKNGIFKGIKLYPALGYYPFDRDLLEVYKYALERQVPIMTHCIRGTVFYRGKKKTGWNKHPILKYNKGNKDFQPIPLPQSKNYDFTTNFTHPLNYECLLNKSLLSEFVGEELDLGELKICLAHFGGGDEWKKYMSDAWNNYNNLISPVSKSEYESSRIKNTLNHGSPRTIWWNASWLSVIYDLMIRYPNVYADISFILHDRELFPILKYLLQDPKVREKILFGTDYYVVSQKGLDKELYQRIRSYLGEELFELIAIKNPGEYLQTK